MRLLTQSVRSSRTLLLHAARLRAYQGNERIVAFLLQRGARVDASAQQGGAYVNTPLMMAAIQGHERIARMLLGLEPMPTCACLAATRRASSQPSTTTRRSCSCCNAHRSSTVSGLRPQCRQIWATILRSG